MKKKKNNNKTQNQYINQRNLIVKWYVGIFAGAFLLSLILFLIADYSGMKFLETLALIPVMADSILLVMLAPLIIYLIRLSMKAKEDLAMDGNARVINRAQVRAQRAILGVEEQKYPWGSIIALLFILPPLGALFLFLKLFEQPFYYLENSVWCKAIGYTFTGFGGLFSFFMLRWMLQDTSMDYSNYFFYTPYFMLLLGLGITAAAFVIRKKGKEYALLQKQILVDGMVKIADIAKANNKEYGYVLGLIYFMITHKMLYKSYIDFKAREVRLPADLPRVACKCPHCGGTSIKILGYTSPCDYCGRILR